MIQCSTPSTETDTEDSRPVFSDDDTIEKDFGPGTLRRDEVHPLQHCYSISDDPLSFIGKTSIFECTGSGCTLLLNEHGITVVIPPGAMTKPAEIEVGVLLSGPFKFPSNTTQVSVVLWVCAKNRKSLKLSKPIEVNLPHFIDCSNPQEINKLAFVKATHDSLLSERPFTFTEVSDSAVIFGDGKGTVFMKQVGFFCIVHKVPERVPEKANFCLISTMPKHITEIKFEINFYVVYSLKTCIEVIICTVGLAQDKVYREPPGL